MNLSRVSRIVLLISPLALTLATGTYAQDQYPILDKVAAKVMQKYQSTPCEELMAKETSPHNRLPSRNRRQSSFSRPIRRCGPSSLIKWLPRLPTKCSNAG